MRLKSYRVVILCALALNCMAAAALRADEVPPSIEPPYHPTTFVCISLRLQPENEVLEEQAIEMIDDIAHVVDGVIIKVWAMQNLPNAESHRLVLRARELCTQNELQFYWGRNLFINHPNCDSSQDPPDPWFQHPDDWKSATYIANALSNLAAEAVALEADGTYMDSEPYGDCGGGVPHPIDVVFWDEWNQDKRMEAWSAIGTARFIMGAPPATIADPGSHWNCAVEPDPSDPEVPACAVPGHYGWTYRHLGTQYHCRGTYKRCDPHNVELNPKFYPPLAAPWEDVDLHWVGSWMTADEHDPLCPGNQHINVEEWASIDWDAVLAAYPENAQGGALILLPGGQDRIDIMTALAALP